MVVQITAGLAVTVQHGDLLALSVAASYFPIRLKAFLVANGREWLRVWKAIWFIWETQYVDGASNAQTCG